MRIVLGAVVALLMLAAIVVCGWLLFAPAGLNWISFLPYMVGGFAFALCVEALLHRLRG